MLFSIIIANYNKAENIPALLSSIYINYPYNDFELFFMDDASTDSSVVEAKRFPIQVRVSEVHLGPAVLRNMAAKEANGKYLLFIDSDVILPAQTMANFRKHCLAEEFDALSALEVLPPVIDNWIGYFRTLQIQDQWGEYRTKGAAVEAWGATFGAIRRDLFIAIGGFNESYKGADVEDHELAARIPGEKKILFTPDLTYRHSYPTTVQLVIKQFKRASQMVTFKKEVLFAHSFYGWRYKINHLLAPVTLAGSMLSLFDLRWIYVVILTLLFRAASNYYLLSQALKIKGFLFTAYCFAVTLIMSLSIIAGAAYGKLLWKEK